MKIELQYQRQNIRSLYVFHVECVYGEIKEFILKILFERKIAKHRALEEWSGEQNIEYCLKINMWPISLGAEYMSIYQKIIYLKQNKFSKKSERCYFITL